VWVILRKYGAVFARDYSAPAAFCTTETALVAIFFRPSVPGFGRWPALGCVFRTASAKIRRSSAFVFGGSRVKLDF
jgi:hypothetical protein